jgi:hypothetical protein
MEIRTLEKVGCQSIRIVEKVYPSKPLDNERKQEQQEKQQKMKEPGKGSQLDISI